MYAKLHSRKGNLLIRLIITAFLVFWALCRFIRLYGLFSFPSKAMKKFLEEILPGLRLYGKLKIIKMR